MNDGSEFLTVNDGSERRKKWQRIPDHDMMIALNTKLWRDSDSEHQAGNATLNTKLKTRLWMQNWENSDSERQTGDVALNSKLKRDGGCERRTGDGGSERQTEKMKALNAKLRRTTLNAQTEKI